VAQNESGDTKSPESNMHSKNNMKCYEPKLRKIYDMSITSYKLELIKCDCSSQTFHLNNSRLNTITVTTTSSFFLKDVFQKLLL